MVYWSKKEECAVELEQPSSGFVALSVSSNARDTGLSVRLPNGITIEGINDRSVDFVSRLIEQL